MTHPLVLFSLIAIPVLAFAQENANRDPHETHHQHQDPKALIAILDDPARDAYQKPEEVIAALKLKEGEVVADIGAASGYFSFRIAPHLGSTGRVYAADISPEMILHMNRRIRDQKLTNVATILCAENDPLLSDNSINRFLIVNTWHHIPDHATFLGLLKKMLKPGGQVVMVDFKKVQTPVGPPLAMRIARDDLVKEMDTSGFHLQAEHDFLPYQYFLVFSTK